MEYPITVIVPIYQTEAFIEKCILSLCNQTLDDFEIILVNDCSPDNAIDIAKNILSKFPLRKENTHIISLATNQGLPNARKVGLSHAKGKYIASLDSDDYLEPNALELMLNKIQEMDSDMLVCDYFFSTKKKEFYIKQECPNSNKDFLKKLFTAKLQGFWWNKLYKKELLEKVDIFTDIHMQEDLLVAVQMGLISSNIAYLPKAVVHYVQYNTNSMTKNYTEKSIRDLLFVMDWVEREINASGNYEALFESINYRRYLIKSDIITYSNHRREYFSLYDSKLLSFNSKLKLPLYKRFLFWLVDNRLYHLVDLILFIRKIKWKFIYS